MEFIQGISITQVVSALALVLIGVLAYKTILTLSEVQMRKRYVLKSFLKEGLGEQEGAKDLTLFERIGSWGRYRQYVEAKLIDAKSEKSFQQFMMKRFLFAIVAIAYGFGVGVALNIPLFTYIAIPLGILMFNVPMKQLEKQKQSYKRQLRVELPDYLSAFSILLYSHTPQNAVRESVQYTDGALKPYVEQLVTDIELYPADSRPYTNFAKAVDVREAKEFMVALEQMMKVDASKSKEIIDYQIEIMSELQILTYKEEVENRETVLERFTLSMILPFIVVTFTFIGVLMWTQFQNFITF